MAEDVATIENKLNRLWLDAGEMAKKWQPLIDWYVTGSVGLQPWNCDKKERDENGRLINIRKFEGDDNFASDCYDFQMIFDSWNDRLEGWLSETSPRFRRRFDEVYAEAGRFSEQYDSRYTYIGEVPELLAQYDDFYKKKAAIDDLISRVGSDGWGIRENSDIALELVYVKRSLDDFLCVRRDHHTYIIHKLRDGSSFQLVLEKALDKNNKTHRINMNASKFQGNVSKLGIPKALQSLMIKATKQAFIVKPQITYGDLRSKEIDNRVVDDFCASLEKLELT